MLAFLAYSLLPVALAGLRNRCKTALDCSLNGDCLDGHCRCDAAWAGSPHCDVLAFEPASRAGGYHNDSYSSWGGNAILEDGKYHLFVAQFVNHCGLGQWGSASSIVRAVASHADGPYEYQETVIPVFSHNPTVRRRPDGSFALYMIGSGTGGTPPNCTDGIPDEPIAASETFTGGIYVSSAPTVYGPWTSPEKVEFANSTDQLHAGWGNPSPHFMADGTIYLAFQAQAEHLPKGHVGGALVGIAKGTELSGPFSYLLAQPVTPDHLWCIGGRDEDPFMWVSPRGFHIITHGMCPTAFLQAHYKYSEDGVSWHTSPRQTYNYAVRFEDGITHFPRLERPQLVFGTTHPDGAVSDPLVLLNAVCSDKNYLAGFNTCDLKQWGVTHTIARPLQQEAVIL